MGLLKRRPRVLALGEPTHGEEQLLGVRNELFRQLVEQEGYRTIAIESDCLTGLVVDDYVRAGRGTLDEVMAGGFSHGWGTFAGNRELVRWLRAHNDGRPAGERVRFAGFDGPLEITGAASPRPALTAVHGYLRDWADAELLPGDDLEALLGDDDRWTNPAAMMDPSASIGRSPEARQLRLIADDLAALLDAQTPQLVAATSRQEWERARLRARAAAGVLRYHYWTADAAPGRLARLLALRDEMMAANLLDLAERSPTLVSAHNGHLQRDKSSMRLAEQPLRWWSAGAIVDARLGDEYAFLATALGTIHHQGVGVPPPDTIEGVLYARAADCSIVDTRSLPSTGLRPRVSPWFGYAPLDPAHVNVDGLVFVRNDPR